MLLSLAKIEFSESTVSIEWCTQLLLEQLQVIPAAHDGILFCGNTFYMMMFGGLPFKAAIYTVDSLTARWNS
jgi:hypothetical protein